MRPWSWMLPLCCLTCFVGPASDALTGDAPPAADEQAVFLGRPLAYWVQQASAAQRQEGPARIAQALTAALESNQPKQQVAAVDALQMLGPDAQGAIDALVRTLATPQAWLGVAAMDVLAGLGKEAVPALIVGFEQGTGSKRFRSALVLGSIGPDAQAALPVLEQALAQETPATRARLQDVIRSIRGEPTAPAGVAAPQAAPVPGVTISPAAAGAGDWPQFHGPRRDAICTETGLLTDWSQGGPPLLWKLDGLGRGYSTISIANGKFFTLGDRPTAAGQEAQFVMAYDLALRRQVWAVRVGPPNSDGGPRCTPTVTDGRVYVLGTDSDLVCLREDTGAVLWQKNLAQDFGGKMMSTWKFSESPLVDGDRVICTPGVPEAALVALDRRTGEVLWKCALPRLGDQGADGAGYSSVMAAEIVGQRQYVQLLGRGVIGVDAATGRFLWGYNRVANTVANITAPVVRGDFVFVTTSYRTGSALLKITRDGDAWKADEVYFLEARQFENHHGGVAVVGDYVYGGSGQNKGWPGCLKLGTGELAWKERPPAAGSAAVLYADGHLLFRYDRGPVTIVEATPQAYRLKGTFTPLLGDGPAWAHPVIHRGKLYLRHADLLACYDLRRE
jgi:outer membrane protein assembly factor BamB